jgi:hypothetical protein
MKKATQKDMLVKALEAMGIGKHTEKFYYWDGDWRVTIFEKRVSDAFEILPSVEFQFAPDGAFETMDVEEGYLTGEMEEDETASQGTPSE